MKRSPSSPPPSVKSESREDTPCPPAPSTPKPKKAKKAPAASPHTPDVKLSNGPGSAWTTTPGWTPEKKQTLEFKIIEAGIAAIDKATLADELNLTKSQLGNALCRGMKGNLRDQMLKKTGGSGN